LRLLQRRVKEAFVHLGRAMLIGIGKRPFGGGGGDHEVVDLATGETQAIADFAKLFA
jgi:hypothetical protein